MPEWPSTLPQTPLQDGFQEVLPNNVITTQMDAGPSKVRRRATANVVKYKMNYDLTLTERNAFVTFFNDTIAGGSLSFDFPNPYTGATETFRIDMTQGPPQITPLNGVLYRLSLSMEKLP